MVQGKKLSETEKAKILSRSEDGFGPSKIAKELGVTPRCISNYLRSFGKNRETRVTFPKSQVKNEVDSNTPNLGGQNKMSESKEIEAFKQDISRMEQSIKSLADTISPLAQSQRAEGEKQRQQEEQQKIKTLFQELSIPLKEEFQSELEKKLSEHVKVLDGKLENSLSRITDTVQKLLPKDPHAEHNSKHLSHLLSDQCQDGSCFRQLSEGSKDELRRILTSPIAKGRLKEIGIEMGVTTEELAVRQSQLVDLLRSSEIQPANETTDEEKVLEISKLKPTK